MIFGSDNQSGASERVLEGLMEAYRSPAPAYGRDPLCQAAKEKLKEVFDTDLSAFFVMSGTAANTLALSTLVQPWEGVVCYHQAHLLLDESTGPSLMTGGAALLPIPSDETRILLPEFEAHLDRLPKNVPHNVRPAAFTLSQANEVGQIYSVDEVHALCGAAKERGLGVHMDGARFANAVAKLGCHPADISWRAGVDVLCLGATKNGAVAAEAVIFFNKDLAKDFSYRVKRSGHLVSKGRLFGAQFLSWLEDDHWLELATTANRAAENLRQGLAALPGVRLAFPTQSNELFVIMPKELFKTLTGAGATLFPWPLDVLPSGATVGPDEMLARLVTSFATQKDEVDAFLSLAKKG
ncbi:MAG: threonine aldolase [Rhodobiaceae bacterium]|nr:MAG: threonine aldolase [Rhodobiaceae bacterium]